MKPWLREPHLATGLPVWVPFVARQYRNMLLWFWIEGKRLSVSSWSQAEKHLTALILKA